MSEDILCPECGHSMAYHGWYSGCECPVNGVFNKCKCSQTHYSQYITIRKQLDEWKSAHDNLARQLSTTNDLLEIAVEALEYYYDNAEAGVGLGGEVARIALEKIEGLRGKDGYSKDDY
jgi:hypothetical protein